MCAYEVSLITEVFEENSTVAMQVNYYSQRRVPYTKEQNLYNNEQLNRRIQDNFSEKNYGNAHTKTDISIT